MESTMEKPSRSYEFVIKYGKEKWTYICKCHAREAIANGESVTKLKRGKNLWECCVYGCHYTASYTVDLSE